MQAAAAGAAAQSAIAYTAQQAANLVQNAVVVELFPANTVHVASYHVMLTAGGGWSNLAQCHVDATAGAAHAVMQ